METNTFSGTTIAMADYHMEELVYELNYESARIARKVADAVTEGYFEGGILMSDTGIGMSIAANKVRGIRAALCHDVFGARRARQHNDANILCLATGQKRDNVREILEAYLTAKFEGGRHLRRLNKIKDLENEAS